MRHSRAVEIRELIIRCVSQMVLARVANVKSGWKSMFMVGGVDQSLWLIVVMWGL
jgi:brefeldin A-inhibited guanine nucleotide-exchange protein